MRPLSFALLLALVVTGCHAAAPAAVGSAAPSTTPEPEVNAAASVTETCPDGSMPIPTRFRENTPWLDADGCSAPRPSPVPYVPPPMAPMPDVALRSAAFTASAPPVAQRVAASQLPSYATDGFGPSLMDLLDRARGGGVYASKGGIASDDEWNMRIWPGPFQEIARRVAATKPPAGRFFHFESLTVDALYALPWAALPSFPGVPTNGFQFVDVTITFRDHAETPPAEGELWYTWHLRLPTAGTSVFAIADGYDGVSAKTWMATDAYWSRSRLENEAKSAVAGYLWSESFVDGGGSVGPGASDTTPFWHERIAALNDLNALHMAGRLPDRHFEDVSVRVDAFTPMTVFGGGVVLATIAGRLVETIDGKTRVVPFTQPMKFFRFGASPIALSGWTAVDAQQDGAWVSGGNLALDKLQTAHG